MGVDPCLVCFLKRCVAWQTELEMRKWRILFGKTSCMCVFDWIRPRIDGPRESLSPRLEEAVELATRLGGWRELVVEMDQLNG
jgi:hypothetical protein